MSFALTIGVLVAAGVMLVVQNLLMVRITVSSSTVLIALVVNSGVGLVLLLSALIARSGVDGVAEALQSFKPWYIVPGLLGSLFVFASILGYQRVGAAVTISTLVASQLIAGLVSDGMTPGAGLPRIEPMSVIGAVLLVAGAVLIARGRI
jgi:bacterial/archaeal transporter family-2 protein